MKIARRKGQQEAERERGGPLLGGGVSPPTNPKGVERSFAGTGGRFVAGHVS